MCLVALAGTIGGLSSAATAQSPVGNAFTYQGRLDDSGVPANGLYDFQFQLAPAASGSFMGASVNVDDVNVVNGLFTVKLNFGAAFYGDARFIEARVRPGASVGLYTPLAPRQELTPAPYAVGLALPFSEIQSSASPLFSLDQNGAGGCMALTDTNGDCLNVGTDGTGDAIVAHTSGPAATALFAYTTGAGSKAVYGQTNNGGVPIYGYNLGTTGNTAFFRNESMANDSNCVEIQENGTGVGLHANARADRAAWFENTNASNPNVVMVAQNTGGSGAAIWGQTTGAGPAGLFTISNAANNQPAISASTNGTGPAGSFTGRVDVNGKLNAQVGGFLNRATPIAWGHISPGPITVLSSSGNVAITNSGRIQVLGEGSPNNWVIIATCEFGSNVPTDHHWTVRTSHPALDGTFNLDGDCQGCPVFSSDDVTYSFVIYQGQ
jgi:hypothetical protein